MHRIESNGTGKCILAADATRQRATYFIWRVWINYLRNLFDYFQITQSGYLQLVEENKFLRRLNTFLFNNAVWFVQQIVVTSKHKHRQCFISRVEKLLCTVYEIGFSTTTNDSLIMCIGLGQLKNLTGFEILVLAVKDIG